MTWWPPIKDSGAQTTIPVSTGLSMDIQTGLTSFAELIKEQLHHMRVKIGSR